MRGQPARHRLAQRGANWPHSAHLPGPLRQFRKEEAEGRLYFGGHGQIQLADISCGPLPPLIRNNTAMRTARPLVTRSRITERSPSAMSLSISTPRLIGPGCMISTSGLGNREALFVEPEEFRIFVDA